MLISWYIRYNILIPAGNQRRQHGVQDLRELKIFENNSSKEMSQSVNEFAHRLLIQHISSLPLFAQYWIACWLELVVLHLNCCVLQFCSLFHFSYTLYLFLSHSLFAAVWNRKAIGNNPVFVIWPISAVSHIYTRLKQSKCYAVVHIKKGSLANIAVKFMALRCHNYSLILIGWCYNYLLISIDYSSAKYSVGKFRG
jgi:hypothetical protein